MKGISRPQSERKAVIKFYKESKLGVRKVAEHFNLPEATVYNWIKPYSRHRAKFRLGDEAAMIESVNRARLKVYYGYSVSDALELEDLNRSTYYRYLSSHPFATQADLISAELSKLLQLDLPPEAKKCITRIFNLTFRETKVKLRIPLTDPKTS